MKVAIFEMEHFEGAFPVIRLFDQPGNEITIITSPETQRRFTDLFLDDVKRYQWSILHKKSKRGFFYSLYKCLKNLNPDLLYINTISDNHLLYAWVLQSLHLKRIVLTVHDINCLFESRPSLKFRQAIIHYGKKQLVKRVHEFNVVADTMLPYLHTKTKQKKTHNIPGAVFEGRYRPQPIHTALRIVVPGSLDKRRRDYEQVFQLAALAGREKLFLEMILLGGCPGEEGKTILERAAGFRSDYCKIIFYNQPVVDQDEFDRHMDNAHFVFIPSVVNTRICGDIPEIYGLTKSSGNIFDVIKHAKPFIVPLELTIPANLLSSAFRYDSIPGIITFLKSILISPTEYDSWQARALENSKNYTIEKLRAGNGSLVEIMNY